MGRKGVVAALAAAVAAVAIVLAVLASGGGEPGRPGGAGAAPGMEVALQDDAVFTHRYYYDRDRAFAQARALSAGWLRITIVWATAAGGAASPADVRWQWGQYDDAIDAARAHGMQVELTLAGPAPPWATADGRRGVTRPDPRLYAQFVRAAAEHFRGRVPRYSIWNEPNYSAWIRPLADAPAIYRALYLAARPAVQAADPGAQVLIGETAAYGRPPASRSRRSPSCARSHARAARGSWPTATRITPTTTRTTSSSRAAARAPTT